MSKPLASGDNSAEMAAEAEFGIFLNTSAMAPRIVNGVLVATITSVWLHWWALAWLVGYFLLEVMIDPSLRARLLGRGPMTQDEGVAAPSFAALWAVMAHFTLAWGAAWVVGGPAAGFVTGLFLAATVLQSVIFMSSKLSTFLVAISAPVCFALVATFFVVPDPLLRAATLLSVLHLLASALAGRHYRSELIRNLLRARTEMKTERDASLAKSRFLATMSHELRTPLNAVIGYAEILEEDLSSESKDEQAQDAARIQRAARNLLILINEILDYSKIEAGRAEVALGSVDVRELIEDVVATTAHIAAANNVAVNGIISLEGGRINTDGHKLRQCVLNLVSNACKFTKDGTVAIRADIEETATERYLRVDVTDSGCGISEADRARLFQPFVQVDSTLTRSKGGTGLGLVIVERLSELLGGDVRFVSKVGEGSCFTLRVRAWTEATVANTSGEAPERTLRLAAA